MKVQLDSDNATLPNFLSDMIHMMKVQLEPHFFSIFGDGFDYEEYLFDG